jgi:hypothetical protein
MPMGTRGFAVAVLCVGAVLVWTEPVRADRSQSFTGNTTGAPTFNRPIEDGTGGFAPFQVHYQAQRFRLLGDALCVINGTQAYDGYLHLYRSPFNPASPLANLIDGDDDGELAQGSSRIPHDVSVSNLALTAGSYVLVTSGFDPAGEGSFQNFVSCNGDVQPLHGFTTSFLSDIPLQQQVWLNDRFVVAIDQVSNHPSDGIATPVRFGSKDSAFFWFYNDTNFEVLVKVLDACQINGHWWVFLAGTTNQAHRVLVGDSMTGQVKAYSRSLGPPAPAVTDTLTPFPCPAP